jgi:hypothetical protein
LFCTGVKLGLTQQVKDRYAVFEDRVKGKYVDQKGIRRKEGGEIV